MRTSSELKRAWMQGVVTAAAIGCGVAGGVYLASGTGATAQNASPAAVRIATADVLSLVERQLSSDKYQPAMAALRDQWTAKLRGMGGELEALQRQAQGLKAGAPELEELERQFNEKRSAFETGNAQATRELEKLYRDQAEESYILIVQAADALAREQGYSHVLATRSGAVSIRSDNVSGALEEMLARPVIVTRGQDDLTEALARTLGIPATAQTPASGQPQAAPTPAQAPR